MVKTLPGNYQAKPKREAPTREYKPEEFDADTDEERPIALIAERRRQFLVELEARQPGTSHSLQEQVSAFFGYGQGC